jgi:arylsulfatase A-like enzyme
MKRVYTCATVVAAVSLISLPSRADDPPPLTTRPNILLIVLDDVGIDKFKVYNPAAGAKTPYIDQLAHEGIYFTNAYAQPKCAPTRATIMTGRYAFRTGFGENNASLSQYEVGLAKLIKGGITTPPFYSCGAFGKWHLIAGEYFHNQTGWEHPTATTYGQFFDAFDGHMGNVTEEGTVLHHYHWYRAFSQAGNSWEQEINGGNPPCPDITYSAEQTRVSASDWIHAPTTTQPFFAYVCFNAPHAPLQIPPQSRVSASTWSDIINVYNYQYQGQSSHCPDPTDACRPENIRVLDWMLESVDTEIKMLMDSMDSATRDNTLVIIVGDNGTPGPFAAVPPNDPNHGKATVYEQGVRVPLIVKGPGVNAQYAYTACSGLVHTVDIFPTIAAILGIPLPPNIDIDGVSFWQMISNPFAASHRTQVFTQIFFPPNAYTPDPNNYPDPNKITWQDRSMRDSRYKYIRKYNKNLPTPITEEAYDLQTDPYEQSNLLMSATTPPQVLMRINALKLQMIALSGK